MSIETSPPAVDQQLGLNQTSPSPSRDGSGMADSERSDLTQAQGNQGKKKKKKSRNCMRQMLSDPARESSEGEFGRHKLFLESTAQYPSIFAEPRDRAVAFAKEASTFSGECFVLFVDGSCVTPSPVPDSPSSSSSPSSLDLARTTSRSSDESTLTSSPRRLDGGASVVYKNEKGDWVCVGFSLPGVSGSTEAEMRAVEQSLRLAIDKFLMGSTSQKDVVILTDSQQALEVLAEHIAGKPSQIWEAAEAASQYASKLRKSGLEVTLRWVPGHMGIVGNLMADRIAQNGMFYTSNLGERATRELAGKVHRMENPYDQRPRADLLD